jgi:hypothetical protein
VDDCQYGNIIKLGEKKKKTQWFCWVGLFLTIAGTPFRTSTFLYYPPKKKALFTSLPTVCLLPHCLYCFQKWWNFRKINKSQKLKSCEGKYWIFQNILFVGMKISKWKFNCLGRHVLKLPRFYITLLASLWNNSPYWSFFGLNCQYSISGWNKEKKKWGS